MSKIQWTERTWNPVVGCTPVSAGCLNCYAAGMAPRLARMGRAQYADLTAFEDHHPPPSRHAGAGEGATRICSVKGRGCARCSMRDEARVSGRRTKRAC